MKKSLAAYDIATYEKREKRFTLFFDKNGDALKKSIMEPGPKPDWLVHQERSEALLKMAAIVVPAATMIGLTAYVFNALGR